VFERDHRAYYEARAAHATELGQQASDPKVAALHFELALRYGMLAVQGSHARPDVIADNLQGSGSSPEQRSAMFDGATLAHPDEQPRRQQA
jgi:hypothetical protein